MPVVQPPEGWGWCMACDGFEQWAYLKRVGSGPAKCAECRGRPEEYEDEN